jgi:hypothetical protein
VGQDRGVAGLDAEQGGLHPEQRDQAEPAVGRGQPHPYPALHNE